MKKLTRAEVDAKCEEIAKEIKHTWGGDHVRLYQEFNTGFRVNPIGSWSAIIVNRGDHETSVGGYKTRLGAMRALLRAAQEECRA